jgi:hypothetical protein
LRQFSRLGRVDVRLFSAKVPSSDGPKPAKVKEEMFGNLLHHETCVSAPLLSRVKSWQLIGLGISGWCTLYSVAMITWGASSITIGHAQGGCFAATMTLAGFEAKRHKKGIPIPEDPLQWASGISTEHLNQAIAQTMQQREFRVEPCHALETELGFGVRAINAGRTVVFETSRWKEPIIDVLHAQTTEENRKKTSAVRAVIVSAGKPDEGAQTFAKTHPVSFLGGQELKDMFNAGKPIEEKPGTAQRPKTGFIPMVLGFIPRLTQRCRSAIASSRRNKSKRRRSSWMI